MKSKKPSPPKPKKRHPGDEVDRFVQAAHHTPGNTVFIGIDPGTTGAIAFRCNGAYCVIDIPVIVTKMRKTRKTSQRERRKNGGKKSKVVDSEDRQFDLPAIVALFRKFKALKERVKVILEQVPVTLGPGRLYADVMLNRSWAMWPLFLTTKGYAVYNRKPTDWKARMGLLKADKEQSRRKALKLFPEADCPLKKHHNRAEALLLVEALRRELKIGTQV